MRKGILEMEGSKPVPIWEQSYQALQTTVLPQINEQLDKLPKKNFTVLRVSQLDANELDTQLASLLATQIKQIWVLTEPFPSEYGRQTILQSMAEESCLFFCYVLFGYQAETARFL